MGAAVAEVGDEDFDCFVDVALVVEDRSGAEGVANLAANGRYLPLILDRKERRCRFAVDYGDEGVVAISLDGSVKPFMINE